jgi:hypothetical protein
MAATLPTLVYTLCFLTSAACGFMLMRNYRRTGVRLLFWSGLCFVLLAANNLVVIFDLLVLPDVNLQVARLSFSLIAVLVLLFGFIWDLDG